MQHTKLAAALCAVLSANALANPQPQLPAAEFTLEEIVVTATRIPQFRNAVLPDVSVIVREEIEKSGATTLSEVLQQQAGVEISQKGGAGSSSSVFLRGGNAQHTLVLVDGVRMTSATLGSARLEHIPLALIERIEVVRGPMSHLYGSEAVGGVVQIFTNRGGNEPMRTAHVSVGSYGHTAFGAGLSGSADKLKYSLTAGQNKQDGFSAQTTAYADKDGYENTHVALNMDYAINAAHALSLHGFHSDGQSQFDDDATAYDSNTHVRMGNAGLALNSRLNEAWNSVLRADFASEDARTFGNGYASKITMDQWQYNLQLDGRLPVGEVQVLAERIEQDIGGDVRYDKKHRTRNALNLSWRKEIASHMVNLSVRRDDDSQFGHHDTGAAGYAYKFAPGWRAVASYGTSFRAPAFDDLYWPGSGNPNLKPESGKNKELGLRYNSAKRTASVMAYRNDVSNLIQWANVGGGVWLPSNVAKAKLQGLSLSWSERMGVVRLRSSLDIQSPENAATGKLLILRSRQHAGLGLDIETNSKLKWSADVIAQGERYNNETNTEAQKVAGYALVNLGATYQIEKDWQLQASLNNALDKDYRLAHGYNTPGRSLFVTLRYAPK